MAEQRVDTLVVGGGQAGVAMSEHLGRAGISHVVLERGRIAERWRSGRWDSLVANGPAWHDRFPGATFTSHGPEDFPGKEAMADYFVDYVSRLKAPVREGVEVTRVTKAEGQSGFVIETSDGVWRADHVVAATGAFQVPMRPDMIPDSAGLHQMHSAAYRNPGQLPPGGVVVVGAGSSGAQIAEELSEAGRRVWICVGPHDRPPRRYRGRDYCWWLGVLGLWDLQSPGPNMEHVTIAVSGAKGGRTVDFRRFAAQGITLTGRAEGFDSGVLRFKDDLAENLAFGDRNYLSVLDGADDYAARNGLDLPPDPEARQVWPDPDCLTRPIRSLDLKAAGVSTVLWATGYKRDYSWLQADAFDDQGRPAHRRGISTEPGVYFLGLPWQSRRGSSFIWGVWHDARFIADQIGIRRAYAAYEPGRG